MTGMKLRGARELFLVTRQADFKDPELCQACRLVLADFISYVGNLNVDQFSAENVSEYAASFVERPARIFMPFSGLDSYALLRIWVRWLYNEGFTSTIELPAEVEYLFQYLGSRSTLRWTGYPSLSLS
jgi:hypothetical protein